MSLPNRSLASCEPKLWSEYPTLSDARQVERLVEAKYLTMRCPGCLDTEREHTLRLRVSMEAGKNTGWYAQGDTVANLTFLDDGTVPHRTRSVKQLGHPCHVHFNITNGQIDHYVDSTSP